MIFTNIHLDTFCGVNNFRIKNDLAQTVKASYQFNGERIAMIDFSLIQDLEETNGKFIIFKGTNIPPNLE